MLSFLTTRIRPPPCFTLFPYTTLFRSCRISAVWGNEPMVVVGYRGNFRRWACFFARSGYGLWRQRSEEHTSELQSRPHLVCRLLLEKKKRRLPSPTRRVTVIFLHRFFR